MLSFTQFLTEAPGLYAAFTLRPESAEQLHQFVTSYKLPDPQPASSYHITTVYTRKPIEHTPAEDTGVVVKPISYEMFGTDDLKYLVLCVDAPEAHTQFQTAIDNGAETDFPNYRPHITLTQKIPADSIDLSTLPLPQFPIVLGHEYTAPLREPVDTSE